MSRAISKVGKIAHPTIVFLSLIIIFILSPFLLYSINFMGKIYPNTFVGGVNVGGKLPSEATELLSQKIVKPAKINFITPSASFELNTESIDLNYDFMESAERAFNLTRTGNFFLDSVKRVGLLRNREDIGLITNLDETKLTNFTSVIAGQVTLSPVYPTVEVSGQNIRVNRGTLGSQIDVQLFRALVGHNLAYATAGDITIPLSVVDPTLNDQEALAAKDRAEKYLGKTLSMNFEAQSFDYSRNNLLTFLNPAGGYSDNVVNNAIYKIATQINRDPQNSKFDFDGKKVTEFQPALDGITLDNEKLKELLLAKIDDLGAGESKTLAFDIPVTRIKPEITIDQVNNLGIKELIGRGNSTYFHSIPGRVFNVNLAASRINGTLVKPGDTFSFNQTLGDVSKFTGYQQAYIISAGKTILGDGGGVCQVSTTLFRAALNAGLPINERAAHAYRVGYYEQNSPPGIDATVYAPSPDFKFTNDTPGYILIVAKNDPKKLALSFELYGTSDGRVSVVTKPVISNVTPPLPDLYQDDPTIPTGTVKQTDFAAWGAKVVFNYSVVRAGEQVYKKTFVSNYQPWQAIYLRGTAPQ
jgi:vancomycin resistance protein YoaR